MRRYESVWVVNGDLPDEEVKATIDKFTKIITGHGGKLVTLEEWGRRKLAYKIQGTLRGYYVIADFAGEPATVRELERNYRIDDRVIRYLTVKKAERVDLAALEAEAAAKAQAAKPLAVPPLEAAAEEAVALVTPSETAAEEPAEPESEAALEKEA